MSKTDEITQLFSTIVDPIKYPKLEGKTDKIMEWIKANEARIPELGRKAFMNEISTYCDNDKKIKSALGKVLKEYKQYITDHPPQKPNESTGDDDHKEKPIAGPTETNAAIQLSHIIRSFSDQKLEGKKDQIMEWIQTNSARIPQLNRKGFIDAISAHCGDKKIKGSLGKIWKQYHVELVQYSVSTPGPAPNTTATTETDLDHKGQEEEEPQPTQVTIAPIFSDIIDPIKYTKLEGKTNKIMEWIKANEARIPELERKAFMNEISAYCDDKKIKSTLGKVWKEYTQYITDHPPQKPNESTGDDDNKEKPIVIETNAAILSETTQLLSGIIRPFNDPKLEGKKDQIMEWIQTNSARIPQLNRKGFIDAISAHCGDKKIKGSLGKIWKQYHVELVQYSVSTPGPAPNTTATTETDLDHKGQEEEEPQPTQVTIAPIFSDIIDPIKYTKLEGKTNKIMEWIKANEARIPELERKSFMNEISAYCDDKKIKSTLGKVWKEYTQYITDHPPQKPNESTGDDDNKEKPIVIETNAAILSETTQLLSGIIRPFNDPKLEGKKDQIMEWIETNDARIPQLDRKGFMNEVSAYCDDKKIKTALGKVWKQYLAQLKHEDPGTPVPNTSEIELKHQNASPQPPMAEPKPEEEEVNGRIEADEDDDSGESSSESCYAEHERQLRSVEQMPVYIHRAIWFRSDDEHLERLVDQAVKHLLSPKRSIYWNDAEFITNLYDSKEFEKNVELIGNNFQFFGDFVQTTFKRQLLLDAMAQEEEQNKETTEDEENSDSDDDGQPGIVSRARTSRSDDDNCTHKVWINEQKEDIEDIEDAFGYHICSAKEINLFRQIRDVGDDMLKLNVDAIPDASQNISSDFEWAAWRSCGKALRKQIKETGSTQETYGLWEILNGEKMTQWNEGGKNPGVPIPHLNIIFELLRWYYRQKIECEQKTAVQSHKVLPELVTDALEAQYCATPYKPRLVNIDIYIHDKDIKGDDTPHYVLTWWNCKKRTACNAIAIKNMTGVKDTDKDPIQKYYIRFKVSELNYSSDPRSIEWQWYDNNASEYKQFSDYKYDAENAHLEGLLHKQIEATYQANIDENFPWKWFDKFNGAQISHLRSALVTNGIKQNSSYLVRFTRLSYGIQQPKESDEEEQKKRKRKEKQFERKHKRHSSIMNKNDLEKAMEGDDTPSVHLILSMEQVAVNKSDKTLFARNLKRLKDGKNSLKGQYSGSEPFVKRWLEKYQLATEAQQKYFWSFMLAIATKIKLMNIEIENQLVTIPIREHKKQPQTVFSADATSEVAQEQQDALLYKGFLVPPVLGEAITDAIQSDANASIEKIRESIEKRSKTRVLKKSKVKEQGLINEYDPDAEFVYVHEVGADQYLEQEATMFRFAEIVRKFIIESKHLKNDSSLWPYYRNFSHQQDHKVYHTLVNRFNLSLMFNKKNIFDLFNSDAEETSIGCLRHFSCNDSDSNEPNDETQGEDQIAIRHTRKYAATLLLQRWNTLRNLNVLRQQLSVIFNHFHDEKSTQKEMVEKAIALHEDGTWEGKITKINKELEENIKHKKSGWQFLSEYGNLKDNNPIDIAINEFPFFESFCKQFLFNEVKEDRKKQNDPGENQWFREFKQSWAAIPQWWAPKHDLLLLQLALKYNMNHIDYVAELNGENSFNYRLRLKDRTHYLEFSHFCGQSSNVLHRLSYITNTMVDELLEVKPSLIDIRVPRKQRDEYDYKQESFIFSDYDKSTHEQYVVRELDVIETYKPASKHAKLDSAEHEKYREILNPVIADIVQDLRTTWPPGEKEPIFDKKDTELVPLVVIGAEEEEKAPLIHLPFTRQVRSSDEEDEEEEEFAAKEEESKADKIKNTIDPFISRDLKVELSEVINAFDMIQYGRPMARFVISQIKEYGMDELWTILGVVMEAIPFQMAQEILRSEMESLSRGTPQQLETLCLQMVDGTNWRISSALRMAEYFSQIAEEDALREKEWERISSNFENIAHESVHDIESDHLLYLLLTIPLYDTSEPMNILKLALEQKRTSFLNNDRILKVITHIWHHGASIDIEQELEADEASFSDLLPILFFTPFKFYMTPIGYNWTLSVLFGLYLIYVLLYSFWVSRHVATVGQDLALWALNLGYILYEVSEWCDKGREYFSVTGLMNLFDIMISVCWIVLFIINLFSNPNDFAYLDEIGHKLHDNHENHERLLKAYTSLFGFQIVLLSTRFLTLFQNTEYLGGLLKIVQMMFREIVKFLSVAFVVIAAFTFGFYFIYGLERTAELNEEATTPVDFWDTILFTFGLFVGGGTNADSDVGAIFTVFLTVVGMLVLTNLLIALMSTKYEEFQETAQEEVHFMQIETAIDLAHRDRLMPPPLNVIVYPLGVAIHLFVTLFAPCCNCYSHINRRTYLMLDAFYCGCNRSMRRFYSAKRNHSIGKEQKKIDDAIQRQLYKMDVCSLFAQVSGMSYCVNKCIQQCWCRNRTWCRKICCYKKLYKECKMRAKNTKSANPLAAYHKGCYNCIKLRIKDDQTTTTTVRGMSMKEYISTYEEVHAVKLHLADTILLKHLTADTLLCNYCYQPYLERQVDKQMMPPFRVLMDVISCVAFLFTAWCPLVVFFVAMTIIEQLSQCFDVSIDGAAETTAADDTNKYEEFDREYFPHPEAQSVSFH
eukprot:594922_1